MIEVIRIPFQASFYTRLNVYAPTTESTPKHVVQDVGC